MPKSIHVDPDQTRSAERLSGADIPVHAYATPFEDERAARGDDGLKGAPYLAPKKRLDETRAARKPVLKWTPPAPEAIAAE